MTPKSFDNITEDYLSSLKLKTAELIPSSNETGKIVNNYNCYIAIISNSENAMNAEINDSVQLILSTGEEIKADIEIVSDEYIRFLKMLS